MGFLGVGSKGTCGVALSRAFCSLQRIIRKPSWARLSARSLGGWVHWFTAVRSAVSRFWGAVAVRRRLFTAVRLGGRGAGARRVGAFRRRFRFGLVFGDGGVAVARGPAVWGLVGVAVPGVRWRGWADRARRWASAAAKKRHRSPLILVPGSRLADR